MHNGQSRRVVARRLAAETTSKVDDHIRQKGHDAAPSRPAE